jgi:quinoprotein glucose dehydrogenase
MRIGYLSVLLIATATAWAADIRNFSTWMEYEGGADASQYSSLKQISKGNVNRLQVAWTYSTGESGNYTFDPIVVDGVMYVLAKNNSFVALDAATGKELWVHPNKGAVGTRGANYWESKDRSDRRLLYINGGYLTAIDARTGNTIDSFGDNGRTDLRTGLDREAPRPLQTSNPGRIFENLMIVALPAAGLAYDSNNSDIHAYDVRTGKLAWLFHTVPHPGEFGYDTWPPEAWKTVGGVHSWSEMTVDEKRGIAFIPLGTPRYDFYGPNRKGDNLFGDSLLALDARTGKRLWHFQTVHHDLWDYDLAVAPKLITVRHNGKTVDAVAQATKFGLLFVFNRVTGEPLWPIEERAVPQSDVPGEWSAPTQPFPTKPPPFGRLSFTEKDINPFVSEDAQAKIRDLLKNSRNEGLFTPPSLRGSIRHSQGASWGMVAVDPTKGYLYVISREQPTLSKLELPGKAVNYEDARRRREGLPPTPEDNSFVHYIAPVEFMYQTYNMSPIGPPWSNLTAYDLNTGTIMWQVPNGGIAELEEQGHNNTGARTPRGGPVVTAGGLIFAATASDHKVRAYDQDTGKVLWTYALPTGSDGVPAVYEIDGREYIAFCVAGGDGFQATHRQIASKPPTDLDGTPGDTNSYMVFALPKE